MTSLPTSEVCVLREVLAHPHGTGLGRQYAADIGIAPHEPEPAPYEPEATLAIHRDDYHTHHGRPAKTLMQSVDTDQIATT